MANFIVNYASLRRFTRHGEKHALHRAVEKNFEPALNKHIQRLLADDSAAMPLTALNTLVFGLMNHYEWPAHVPNPASYRSMRARA